MKSDFFTGINYDPYWWEAAPLSHQQTCTNLADVKEPDIAIIGGGFTGISAALTLCRAGKSVVLFDQGPIGYGASSRNGGQIGSGNQKIPISKLEARFGIEGAKQLLNEGVRMLDFLKQLITSEKIQCDLQEVGRFRGAVRPQHYESMAREMEALNRRTRVEYHMVPRSEQHQEINSDYYHGGYVLPGDGLVHPGKLHSGIRQAAVKSGLTLQASTCIRKIKKTGVGFQLDTDRGQIFARDVVLATNGYGGRIGTETEKRIIPVGSAIIATEELSEHKISELMPKLRAYGNSARVFHYFRPSPDNKRILWGGRVGRWRDHTLEHQKQSNWSAFRHLRDDMLKVFPDLSNVKIEYCWSGLIGYSFDELPHLGKDNDGVYYACGYCGTGVTRSVYLGSKIAERVIDQQKGQTAFDQASLPDHSFQYIAPQAVPVVERWYRLRDWSGL